MQHKGAAPFRWPPWPLHNKSAAPAPALRPAASEAHAQCAANSGGLRGGSVSAMPGPPALRKRVCEAANKRQHKSSEPQEASRPPQQRPTTDTQVHAAGHHKPKCVRVRGSCRSNSQINRSIDGSIYQSSAPATNKDTRTKQSNLLAGRPPCLLFFSLLQDASPPPALSRWTRPAANCQRVVSSALHCLKHVQARDRRALKEATNPCTKPFAHSSIHRSNDTFLILTRRLIPSTPKSQEGASATPR